MLSDPRDRLIFNLAITLIISWYVKGARLQDKDMDGFGRELLSGNSFQTCSARNFARISSFLFENSTIPSEFLTAGGCGTYTDLIVLICCHLSAGPPLESVCRA